MTDATEIQKAVGRCSVEHALLAILHALVETGRSPAEIRAGWTKVAREVGLDAEVRTECAQIADAHASGVMKKAKDYKAAGRDARLILLRVVASPLASKMGAPGNG